MMPKELKGDRFMQLKTYIRKIAERNLLGHKIYATLSCIKTHFCKNMSDEEYIKMRYKQAFGKELDLDNPVTFNEKIQWLKLYNRDPKQTLMVDKYLAKDYIRSKIGEKYIISNLGRWDRFEEIDFSQLPEKFVLKCNHDCGSVCICRDKSSFDYKKNKKRLNKALKKNYYWGSREWPYKDVKPCIFAEEFKEDEATGELRDYKFFCCDGEVKALFIASNRQKEDQETCFDFFDADYNHLDIRNGHPNAVPTPEKPKSFEEMKAIAAILSKGFPLLRVDFYEVDEHPLVGELTFSHWNGMVPFDPPEWDEIFGSWIELPIMKKD